MAATVIAAAVAMRAQIRIIRQRRQKKTENSRVPKSSTRLKLFCMLVKSEIVGFQKVIGEEANLRHFNFGNLFFL